MLFKAFYIVSSWKENIINYWCYEVLQTSKLFFNISRNNYYNYFKTEKCITIIYAQLSILESIDTIIFHSIYQSEFLINVENHISVLIKSLFCLPSWKKVLHNSGVPVVHVETAGQWVFHLTMIAWQHRDVVYRDALLLHVYSQFCLKMDTFGMGLSYGE